MSIVVVQISDMHFRANSTFAVGWARDAAMAIESFLITTDTDIVLCLCGDITQSGQATEFAVAEEFVDVIVFHLKQSRQGTLNVTLVVVPGNHDCDFTADQAARDQLLERLTGSARPAPSVEKSLLQPLQNYFKFAKERADQTSITSEHPYFRVVDMRPDGRTVRLLIFNTACTSQRHEEPGSLWFPVDEIDPPRVGPATTIAILHHPTNWYSQPETMRPLRDRLQSAASVVLTHHEHTSDASVITDELESKSTVFIAAGAFHSASTPEVSEFNVLRLDPAARTLTRTRCSRKVAENQAYYELLPPDPEPVDLTNTEDLLGPAGKALRPDFRYRLRDPGAPLHHPHRDPRKPIALSDIFIYPNLIEIDNDKGSTGHQIRSDKVAAEVLSTSRLLLTGAEKSGRTALAKRLFEAAFDSGKLPVMIFGGLSKTYAKTKTAIARAIGEQYANLSVDEWMQSDPSLRVLIVDDAHYMTTPGDSRNELLKELHSHVPFTIFCGNDLIKLDEVQGKNPRASLLWEYRHLQISGFGTSLRHDFVEKWMALSDDMSEEQDVSDPDLEAERICRIIDGVIDHQLFPPFPFYLLAVLQQTNLTEVYVRNGSYGKLFEGVMTAALHRSRIKDVDINAKYMYLAALAFHMFEHGEMYVQPEAARRWHSHYWSDIEIVVDFDSLLRDLKCVNILEFDSNRIQFRHQACFCFFVAYYLHRNIHSESCQRTAKELTERLYHKVSADIVLFLAHLTGNPVILDAMVSNCGKLLTAARPASLRSEETVVDMSFGNEPIAIPESPESNRRRLREIQESDFADRLKSATGDQSVVPDQILDDDVRRMLEFNAAFKSIQILGQALRNVAGSTNKQTKSMILQSIFELAQRIIGAVLEVKTVESVTKIVENYRDSPGSTHVSRSSDEIFRSVLKHIIGLIEFCTYIVIRHTSFSVATVDLMTTIERVLGSPHEPEHLPNSNSALVNQESRRSTIDSTSPFSQLMKLSCSLEHPKGLQRDRENRTFDSIHTNLLAAKVMRMLVANHLYLYEVPYGDRQSVCAKMNIELLPVVVDKTRKRLAD